MSGLWTRALNELGLLTLWHSSRDVKLLCAQRFVRLFAYGGSTLILASYLSTLQIGDNSIGLFMTLTLVGDMVISFLLTLFADAMGRKAVLALGSALMAGSGMILLPAAVLGVISPSGNEIGPFRAVEESTLAHISAPEALSDVYAWYALVGMAGTALGMMVCGWVINFLQATKHWGFVPACHIVFFIYAGVGIVKLILTLGLSREIEAADKQKKKASREGTAGETRSLLDDDNGSNKPEPPKQFLFSVDRNFMLMIINLFILLGLDAFGSGLASLSWMTYFFKRKFTLPEGHLGSIFFTTNIISSASTLIASSIAKRIGNVKTMVFTHLPSAVALALIPIPSVLPFALTFLVLRACSQSMDVAPRAAFLAGALPAEQRTAIMGAMNVVRTCAGSLGPLITGVLADRIFFGLSFILAGILKAVYDVGILACFAGKDPSRQRQASSADEEEQGR